MNEWYCYLEKHHRTRGVHKQYRKHTLLAKNHETIHSARERQKCNC